MANRKMTYEVGGWKEVEPGFEMFYTLYRTSHKDEAEEYFNCSDYTDGFNAYQIDFIDECDDITTIMFKDEEHGLCDDIEALNNHDDEFEVM